MNDRTIHVSSRLLRAAGFAVLAAWAGVHPAAAQSACGSSIATTTPCTLNGFTIYPTSDVAATISNDTIKLTNGSIYLAPTNGNTVRLGTTGQTSNTVIVNTTYTTAGGPSPQQDTVGRGSRGQLNNGASAAWWMVTQNAGGSTVALLQGTLTTPASLTPGCQTTTTAGGVPTTSALSTATDSILNWIATQYTIKINLNNGSPNCSASSLQREGQGSPSLTRAAADLGPASRFAALPVSDGARRWHPAARPSRETPRRTRRS